MIPTEVHLEIGTQDGCDKSMMKFKDPHNNISYLYLHDIVGFKLKN